MIPTVITIAHKEYTERVSITGSNYVEVMNYLSDDINWEIETQGDFLIDLMVDSDDKVEMMTFIVRKDSVLPIYEGCARFQKVRENNKGQFITVQGARLYFNNEFKA